MAGGSRVGEPGHLLATADPSLRRKVEEAQEALAEIAREKDARVRRTHPLE